MLLIRRTFDRYDNKGILPSGDFKTALKDLGHDKDVDEALRRARPASDKGLLYDEYLKVCIPLIIQVLLRLTSWLSGQV